VPNLELVKQPPGHLEVVEDAALDPALVSDIAELLCLLAGER
jgi:hypothetical protein